MIPKLTDEQRRALATHPGKPVEIEDDRTESVYVLLERSQFQRLLGLSPAEGPNEKIGDGGLPAWCNVFEGLTDEEIAELETSILQRADFSRPSP